jgi:hypothetical protein
LQTLARAAVTLVDTSVWVDFFRRASAASGEVRTHRDQVGVRRARARVPDRRLARVASTLGVA